MPGSEDTEPVPSPGAATGRHAAKEAQQALDRAALKALKVRPPSPVRLRLPSHRSPTPHRATPTQGIGVGAQDISLLLPPDTPHAAVAAELGDSLDRQLPSELSIERVGGFLGAWLRKATDTLRPPGSAPPSEAPAEAWDLGNALAVITAIVAALRRVDHGQVAATVSSVMASLTRAAGRLGAASEPAAAGDSPKGRKKGGKAKRRRSQQWTGSHQSLLPMPPTSLPFPPALHALLCMFQHDLAARIMDLQAQCARDQGPEGAGASSGDPHTLLDSLCATMGHLVSVVAPAATALVEEVHKALYMLREAAEHGDGDPAGSASLRVGGQRLIGALHTTLVGAVLPPLLFALTALAPPGTLALALSEQLLPLFASLDRLVSSLDEAKAVESGDRLSFANALPKGPGVGKRADSRPSTAGTASAASAASTGGEDEAEDVGKGTRAGAAEEGDSGSDEDWAFIAAPGRGEAPAEGEGDRSAVRFRPPCRRGGSGWAYPPASPTPLPCPRFCGC